MSQAVTDLNMDCHVEDRTFMACIWEAEPKVNTISMQ